MTEKDIQLALYYHRILISPTNLIMIPNVYFFHWQHWESDLLFITNSGYVTEYEVKITHYDFVADFKKERKHNVLKAGGALKYFYYVCPENVIDVNELPEYAGLMYVKKGDRSIFSDIDFKFRIIIIKEAPKNKHAIKITDEQKFVLLKKGANKYWRLLTKINRLESL